VLEPRTRTTVTNEAELRAILEKVHRQGYCVIDQEMEVDLRSLAIPIHNASGRVVAALHVSAQASKTGKKQMLDEFLPVLRDAALKMRPLLVG